jgi:hypothetical protein
MRLRLLLSIDFILKCSIMLVWTSHWLSTNNYWLAHYYYFVLYNEGDEKEVSVCRALWLGRACLALGFLR